MAGLLPLAFRDGWPTAARLLKIRPLVALGRTSGGGVPAHRCSCRGGRVIGLAAGILLSGGRGTGGSGAAGGAGAGVVAVAVHAWPLVVACCWPAAGARCSGGGRWSG